MGKPMAAEVPMALRMSRLFQSRKGTESVPPPMPTRLETTPMIPPATLMPPRPGRWRDGLGFLPLSIWVITKKRKATKKS